MTPTADQFKPSSDSESERNVGLRHLPLRYTVFAEMRSRIKAGHWVPGEHLLEDQIAAELSVSRNPVREALQALAAEGFVELVPRRGARVATIPRERAFELFQVREALEGLVARLAAQHCDPTQLVKLRALVAEGIDAADQQHHDRLPMLNTKFHQALSAMGGNRLLAEQIDQMSHIIEWIYSHSVAGRSASSWTEHLGIVEAVARGDADEAARLASWHVVLARVAYMDTSEVRA